MFAKIRDFLGSFSWKKVIFISLLGVGVLSASVVSSFLFLADKGKNPAAMPMQEIVAQDTITTLDQRLVLVIDAGHGGADPGALDATETIQEAIVNQQVADKLLELLRPYEKQVEVILAHTAGQEATSMERANVALQADADLFISLHLNSDWKKTLRGFQCFPVPPGRVHSTKSLEFAQILVENMRETEIPIMGTGGIYYTFYAQQPNGSFVKEIYDSGWFNHDEPRRDETFGVLESSGCPSVLVEQWYISNQEDMQLFCNQAGIEKMADRLFQSIFQYFELQPVV